MPSIQKHVLNDERLKHKGEGAEDYVPGTQPIHDKCLLVEEGREEQKEGNGGSKKKATHNPEMGRRS